MKTVTLKADDQFDAELTRLAESLNTTKSQVIRTAVGVERPDQAKQGDGAPNPGSIAQGTVAGIRS